MSTSESGIARSAIITAAIAPARKRPADMGALIPLIRVLLGAAVIAAFLHAAVS
jgi:hypothetical protein